jgi:hypothetical protein
MRQWQYCEMHWQPIGITVTEMTPDGEHIRDSYDAADSHMIFARLGMEGWELTSALSSPTGIHEYWYYFKRPVTT